MPLKIKATLFATGISLVLMLLYLNFTFQPPNLYNYYTNQVSKCLSQNYTACEGQVTVYTYDTGPLWGDITTSYASLFNKLIVTQVRFLDITLNPTQILQNQARFGYYFATNPTFLYGISRQAQYPRAIKEVRSITGQGVSVKRFGNWNEFYQPKTEESFSYYFDTASGQNIPTPLAKVEYEYFNSLTNYATTGYPYNIIGLVKTEKIAGIGDITYGYNLKGKNESINRFGVKKEYSYFSDGNADKEYDYRDGRKIEARAYSNYKFGVPQNVLKAGLYTEKRIINGYAELESYVDGDNNIYSVEYDLLGREKKFTPPVGASIDTTYPDEVTKQSSRGNLTEKIEYDELGREIKSTRWDSATPNEKITRVFKYDEAGRIAFQSQPEFFPSEQGVSTTYDILDRVLTNVRTVDSSVTRYRYLNSDATEIKKPTGHTVTSWYRPFGIDGRKLPVRVSESKVLNPTVNDYITTDLKRDIDGKILEVNQAGVIRKRFYNSSQLLERVQEPEIADSILTYYQDSDLLKSIKRGTNPLIHYTYDDLGRKTNVMIDNGESVNFKYTNTNLVKESKYGNVIKSFTYDENLNKKTEVLSIDGRVLAFDFTYDALDNVETVTYPDTSQFINSPVINRKVLTFTNNSLGQSINAKFDTKNIFSDVRYHANGVTKNLTYGNQSTLKVSLTNTLLPDVLDIQYGSKKITLDYDYGLDNNPNKISDLVDAGYSQEFKYDGVGQLTSAKYPNLGTRAGGNGSLGGIISYSNTGNILNYPEVGKFEKNFSYDETTQYLISVTSDINKTFTYDERGQVISDSVFNFRYDQQSNLIEVKNVNDGNTVANYVYDGANTRVKKIVGNKVNYFFYAGNRLLFEGIPGEGSIEYFFSGSNLIASRSRSLNGESYRYFHSNPVSSVIAVSDESGNLNRENYNSFGSSLSNDSALPNLTKVRFAGQVSDDETGLVYFGSRHYDPSIARFLQPDSAEFSIENPRTFNKYSFANNNPIKFSDAHGKFAFIPLIMAAYNIYDVVHTAHQYFTGQMSGKEAGVNLAMAMIPGGGVVKVGSKAAKTVKAAEKAAEVVEKKAVAAADDGMVTLWHASKKKGLTEIIPQGGTGGMNSRLKGEIKTYLLERGTLPAKDHVIWQRIEWEKGKISAMTNPQETIQYLKGEGGSLYKLKVPKESVIPSSHAPQGAELEEAASFAREVFVEGVVPVVKEIKIPKGFEY